MRGRVAFAIFIAWMLFAALAHAQGNVWPPQGGSWPYNTQLPTAQVFRSGIIPAVHLAKLQAAASPTVCIVGDSTGTQAAADNIAPTDLLWGREQKQLENAYRTKTFNFTGNPTAGNYAIPGTTLLSFTQTLASGWPSWWTNHATTWAANLNQYSCDTLFINFGVNDPGNEPIGTWLAALNAITAWSKIPDIIIVTNAIANPAAGAPFNTYAYQAGYLANGGIQRSIAANYSLTGVTNLPPIGLIDINRLFAMTINGFDPAVQALSWNIPPTAPVSGVSLASAYSLAQSPGGDFSLSITIPSGSAYQTAGTVMTVVLGDGQGGTGGFAGNQVNIQTTNGTTCYMNYYGANGAGINAVANAWVAGANTFVITAQQDHIQLSCNGTIVQDFTAPRYTGPFYPTVTLGSPPASPTMTINSYAIGTMLPYSPTLSAGTCYGASGGASSGNGVNHDSSWCLNQVYESALEATVFR